MKTEEKKTRKVDMGKKVKRLLKIFGVVSGLIFLVVAGIVFYLKTDSARETILKKVNDSIPGTLILKSHRFSLLKAEVEITGFELKGPSDEPIADLDRLFLDISLTALLSKTVLVESLVVEKPRVGLVVDKDGNLNLLGAFPPSSGRTEPEEEKPETGSDIGMVVEQARLTEGEFRFEDRGKGLKAETGQISLIIDGDLRNETGSLDAQIGKTVFDSPELKTAIDRFLVRAALADGRIDIIDCSIAGEPLEATLSGSIMDIGPDPILDAALDLTASLFQIRQITGLDTELTGDVTVKLAAKGKIGDPTLALALDYGGGSIAGNRIENVDLDLDLNSRVVRIKNFGTAVPEGKALLKGEIDLSQAFAGGFLRPPKDLDAIAYNLSLDQEKTALGDLTAENVTGAVESKLTLEGRGITPETLTAKAVLEARAERLSTAPLVRPIDLSVNALAKLNRGKAVVEKLTAETGELKLEGNANYGLSDKKIRADLSLVSENLHDTLSALGIGELDGKTAINLLVGGTVKALEADLEVVGKDISYSDIAIGDVDLKAALDKAGEVSISKLGLLNRGSAISGNGRIKVFAREFQPHPEMPLNFSIDFRDVEPGDFVADLQAGGKIDGNLKLDGNVKKPVANLTIQGQSLAFGAFDLGDADMDLSFAGGTVNLSRADIRKAESALGISGTAQVLDAETGRPIKDPLLKFNLSSEALFIEDFVHGGPTGKLEIALRGEGRPSAPVLELAVKTENLKSGDITVGSTGIDAALDPSGVLTVSRLWLENRGSSVKGEGTVRLFEEQTESGAVPEIHPTLPADLRITFSDIETRDFLDRELASGSLNGELALGGGILKPELTLSLKGKNLAAESVRVGDVDARMTFSDGEAHIEKMTVRNKKSAIDISGNARIFDSEMVRLDNPEFAFAVNSKRLSVRDFTDKLDGVFTVKADIKGTPEKPEGSAKIKGRDIDLGVQKISGLNLLAKFDGEKLFAEQLAIDVAKGESIRGNGWYSPTGSAFDFSLKTDGVSLASIKKAREQNIADGKIVFDIRGKGSVQDPQAEGKIAVANVRLYEKPIDDLNVDFTLENKLLRVSGRQDFKLDGQFNIEDSDFSASLDFDGTDLGPYFGIAGKDDLSGNLTGKLTAGGNANAPEQIRASADFKKLAVFFKDMEIVKTEELKAGFENRTVSVREMRVRLMRDGLLEASGKADLDGPADIRINGNIPLKIASHFVEELPDITGDLDISAELVRKGTPHSGKLAKPDIRAEIALKSAGFTVPHTQQKLADLSGIIHVDENKITVKDLNGQLDEGQFGLGGEIGHNNFDPTKIDLAFTADALPVTVPGTLDALLNARLTAKGTPKKSSLSGEIVVLEGTYFQNVNLEMAILEGAVSKKRESAPQSSGIEYPLLKNMEIDIAVTHRSPFSVDNDLAKLELSPDLRIGGSPNRPIVNGRAQVDSGSIYFRGKEFEVKRGVIDFLNPYKIEPTIDIQSQADIRDWTVTLEISGTPDELIPKFTSTPHLEHADILSLVIFDKTGKELINGDGGESHSTEQMLAELAASTFGDDVKKATGLDILEVDANDRDGSSDRIQVTIGKELSRRMTVKYGMESKDGETVQRAIAEYKFLENVLLNGFRDDTGAFGGELKFRLEFR